jgi:hypothetical protein
MRRREFLLLGNGGLLDSFCCGFVHAVVKAMVECWLRIQIGVQYRIGSWVG